MFTPVQNNDQAVSKPEMEMVEDQKQEYKLLGKFQRTKGLSLFSYNSSNDKLSLVDVSFKNTVEIDLSLNYKSMATEEATVDSREIHFEALNWKSAQRRVDKYNAGKIEDLCNLKEPSKGSINFFN